MEFECHRKTEGQDRNAQSTVFITHCKSHSHYSHPPYFTKCWSVNNLAIRGSTTEKVSERYCLYFVLSLWTYTSAFIWRPCPFEYFQCRSERCLARLQNSSVLVEFCKHSRKYSRKRLYNIDKFWSCAKDSESYYSSSQKDDEHSSLIHSDRIRYCAGPCPWPESFLKQTNIRRAATSPHGINTSTCPSHHGVTKTFRRLIYCCTVRCHITTQWISQTISGMKWYASRVSDCDCPWVTLWYKWM